MITTGNKQTQTAGDNSNQLQANTMIVSLGIDEKRAREIYKEMNETVRKEYSQEALAIASSRVIEFENKLMPKMEAVDGALEAFADPSFQLLLIEAQKTAASSERPIDYDILAELLLHRFNKKTDRIIRTGINRAVEIVDEISDEALLGLTVLHSVSNFFPATGDIETGLNVLDNLFGEILYDNLPTGMDWLDHLDILDAIRINPVSHFLKIEEFYPKMLKEYIIVGLRKGSEDLNKALEILQQNNIPNSILVDHFLNNDFQRLNLSSKEHIDTLILEKKLVENDQVKTMSGYLSSSQKDALISIFDLYVQDESVKKDNISKFMEEWDKRQNLKKLKDWWNNIPIACQVTAVGKVLAHSNAQRCNKNLPPLD